VSTYNRVVAADETASLAPTVRARLATEMADPASEVGASLSDTFAPKLAKLRSHLGTLADPNPPVMETPPTLVEANTFTFTGRFVSADSYGKPGSPNLSGPVTTWDGSQARLELHDGRNAVVDFYFTGTALEFGLIAANTTAGAQVWMLADGVPVSAPPVDGLADGGVSSVRVLRATFGSRARRRITVIVGGATYLREMVTSSVTDIIAPAGNPVRVAFVGDSFSGGSNGNYCMTISVAAALALGVDFVNSGVGGSGYIAGTPFSDSGRIADVVNANPDLIVFIGSVNDTGSTAAAVAAAAATTYDAYTTACPNVPIVVIGVQPSNATVTLSSTSAATNKAVRDAAVAHDSVLAFYDMIGTATTGVAPAAFGTFQTLDLDEMRSSKGSVYRWTKPTGNVGPNRPEASNVWDLLTWCLTGTGKVGSTVGDGTRDALLESDGTHPTVEGSVIMGIAIAGAIVDAVDRATLT